jgi:putative restriction endonuclease
MRSDLHRLFDEGYLTVDPGTRKIAVSRRIREEFDNGRDYYKLEGVRLREPRESWARPTNENLEFQAFNVFR